MGHTFSHHPILQRKKRRLRELSKFPELMQPTSSRAGTQNLVCLITKLYLFIVPAMILETQWLQKPQVQKGVGQEAEEKGKKGFDLRSAICVKATLLLTAFPGRGYERAIV